MRKPVSVTRIETLIQEHGHALWLAMQSGEAGKYGVSCRTASQLMRCSKRTALAVMQALQDAGGVPAAAPVIGEAPSEPVAPVYTDEELIEAKIDRYRRKQARQRSARLSRRMWLLTICQSVSFTSEIRILMMMAVICSCCARIWRWYGARQACMLDVWATSLTTGCAH